ncbi:hypothetical protein L596_009484 [Steinernema carpocapsae]|uniref:G-protein coupled receptors family 1 profile domain-containing protein n=1 Tax=Steinernema carpocapsae TaxID=34508 RepID=A0A4V6A6L3_STECR|nr:hypothetical protein L596_009484 [Steinernema carpocapsae]
MCAERSARMYFSSDIYDIVTTVFWILSITLNISILLPTIFVRVFRRDRFKNLLAQLMLGDIITASGILFRACYLRSASNTTLLECTFGDFPSIAGYHFSQWAVFWIALDRLVAVSYPLRYKSVMVG